MKHFGVCNKTDTLKMQRCSLAFTMEILCLKVQILDRWNTEETHTEEHWRTMKLILIKRTLHTVLLIYCIDQNVVQ